MERIAFKMKLFPGKEQEYKRRHDEIWPELSKLLSESGVSDYSIFLDSETNILFASLVRSTNHRMNELPAQPVMRRWWDYMKDIMAYDSDGTPSVSPLSPMFHMD